MIHTHEYTQLLYILRCKHAFKHVVIQIHTTVTTHAYIHKTYINTYIQIYIYSVIEVMPLIWSS